MPQGWLANWPLPDGTKGLDFVDLWSASETDLKAKATRDRDSVVHTIGNLTILSSALNSAQSNYGWEQKRPEPMKHSLLPLNQCLLEHNEWNEVAIQLRATQLFERARTIWRR